MFNITPEQAKEKFTNIIYEGKKLVPDIFGRAIFYYVAEIKEDQSVNLSGIFKINKKELSIEEVDYIFSGPPVGFIKGIFLYFVGSDVTFREIKRLPCKVSLEELNELRSEEVEIVIFGEEFIKKRTPRLILQDPFGITAFLPDKEDAADLASTGYINRGHSWMCRSDKVHESLTLLHECGWKIETSVGSEVIPFERMELEWEEEGEFIQIKGTVHFKEEKVQLSAIGKDRLVKLSSGKVGLLPDNFKLMQGSKTKFSKNQLGLVKALVGEAVITDVRSPYIPKEKIAPACHFVGNLRPYQLEGLSWLYFLYQNKFSGFLADDMGLGKTIQTLAFLSLLPVESKILIILPATLQFNWRTEIKKFLPSAEPNITIVSYTYLRMNLDLFKDVEWKVIILDEAQTIKNAGTQIFKSVSALKSQFRISISGTPIENHLSELVTHFKFLLPKLELSEDPFELKKLTAPFILRRKKEQVLLELPDKVEETVWIDFGDSQKSIYEQYLKEARSGKLFSTNKIEILEVILRLRQIACHPKLAGFETDESAKMIAVINDLETLVEEGRKVLVFSQFTSMLALLRNELREKNLSSLLLTGETTDREQVVKEFQENNENQIFLISLKAGGVGLNLTAADTVLLYDPWWNLAIEEQAISRAHRMGQKNSVLVKRYVARGTIEEKIEELKLSKKNLATQMIDDDSWKEEDFIELLGLLD